MPRPDPTLLDDWRDRWEGLHEHGRDIPLDHCIRRHCHGAPPDAVAAFRAQAEGPRSMAVWMPRAGAASQPTEGRSLRFRPLRLGHTTSAPGAHATHAVPPAPADLTPGGEPVPGYRLERRLGRGGFGEVWRATAPGGLPVALKFVPLAPQTARAERRALDILKSVRQRE